MMSDWYKSLPIEIREMTENEIIETERDMEINA